MAALYHPQVQYEEVYTMEEYVEKIIRPSFKAQARGKQYAVVVFWTKKNVQTGFRDHFQHISIDSRVESMPNESEYTNHIVARPDRVKKKKTKHSEIILMEKLDGLYEAFKLQTEERLHAIFLYSYLMPCTKCSRVIMKKISTLPYNHLPILIAYSKPYHNSDATLLNSNNIFLYPM